VITKKCNDAFGYGCTYSLEVENEEDISKGFYKKNTWTGSYYQNTCKECTKRKRKELYKSGKYNIRGDNMFYSDKLYTVGKGDIDG
jgi:hypothetical protein